MITSYTKGFRVYRYVFTENIYLQILTGTGEYKSLINVNKLLNQYIHKRINKQKCKARSLSFFLKFHTLTVLVRYILILIAINYLLQRERERVCVKILAIKCIRSACAGNINIV